GSASFLLLVQNSGNAEDAYSATVTGIHGPVTANLVGLDAQPAQAISLFRLPGLSTGAILLQTNLTDIGQGTVTVLVRSLSNPTETATALATVSSVPVLTPSTTPVTINSTEGGSTGTQVVATFTDANPSAATGDYSGTIDWGDGHSTPFTSA